MCEIILKSAHWPRRRCRLKGFSIFSFDGPFVQRSRTILAIMVPGSSKEHSCEIILKSANWPRRKCGLNGFSIFRFDSHFVQQSGTIAAILVEGQPRNISVKLF